MIGKVQISLNRCSAGVNFKIYARDKAFTDIRSVVVSDMERSLCDFANSGAKLAAISLRRGEHDQAKQEEQFH
jgi:hypothetical protein